MPTAQEWQSIPDHLRLNTRRMPGEPEKRWVIRRGTGDLLITGGRLQ